MRRDNSVPGGKALFYAVEDVSQCLPGPLPTRSQGHPAPQAVTTQNVSKHCQMSPGWQNPHPPCLHPPLLRVTHPAHHAHPGAVSVPECASQATGFPPDLFTQDPVPKEIKRTSYSRLFSPPLTALSALSSICSQGKDTCKAWNGLFCPFKSATLF